MLYWLSRDCARNWGRFPFNQNAGFEFSTTSRSEWNGIFKKFRKQGNLARYTQIFNFFSWKFSFQSTLLPENQQFPEFLETFPGNFCTICRRFQILESFGWMESALCLNSTRHCPSLSRDLKWPFSTEFAISFLGELGL